ncbi:MAG: ATP-binding protein [Tepidimonas taiwanensis]|nr:ATP-binding protein [Tepidimonas taiwanensis]
MTRGWATVMRRWTLRHLLLGIFAVTLLVALVVASTLVVGWRFPELLARQEQQQARLAASLAYVVESELRSTERILTTLAATLDHTPSSSSPPLTSHDDASLLPAPPADGALAVLLRLDTRGTIVALQQAPFILPAAQPILSLGDDARGLPPVGAARNRTALEWSGVYLSPFSLQPVVGAAMPLRGGWLVAEMDVQRLTALASSSPWRGQAHVLISDATGTAILTDDPQERLQRRRILPLDALQAVRQSGHWIGRLDRQAQRLWVHTVQLQRVNWLVSVGVTQRDIYEPLWVTALTVLLTAAAAALVGALLTSRAATMLQRRMGNLIEFARGVAQGAYPTLRSHSHLRDVADLEQAMSDMADRVRRREHQLHAIIDSTPGVAVQIYSRSGHVVEWNRASHSILGWSREQALGKRPVELFYDEQQQAAFEALLASIDRDGGAAGPFEGTMRTMDGQTRWLLSTLFAIPAVDGATRLFVCMDVDITAQKSLQTALRQLNSELEQRVLERTQHLQHANAELAQALQHLQQAQDQLVQTEKLAALGSLVAGVAHEINTPVGNARMAISTLQEHLRAFESRWREGLRRSDLQTLLQHVERGTDIALRNLGRAAELVSSFKQVAVDQTSSQRRQFHLHEVVQEILLTLTPQLKHTPYTVSAAVPSDIALDSYPGPLGQVLTNLVQNALIHGLAGRDHGSIRIEASQDATHWRLRVSDDGAGMTEEVRRRAFDPFFTTRLGQGGSGLGLHIVHNVVTGMLGGRIELDTAPGRGTAFTIVCPKVAPRNSATPAPPAP